jgi:hypothetical protein
MERNIRKNPFGNVIQDNYVNQNNYNQPNTSQNIQPPKLKSNLTPTLQDNSNQGYNQQNIPPMNKNMNMNNNFNNANNLNQQQQKEDDLIMKEYESLKIYNSPNGFLRTTASRY